MRSFLTAWILLTPLLFFIALTTHAQAPNFDTFGDKPTVGADGTIDATKSGFVPCSGVTCSPCDLVVLFNTVLKWFMTMAFLLFAVLAILAGFKLISSGGNSGALKEAKGSFTNAFIGLLIILSAWLIVDTLLRKLLPSGNGEISGYGPWSSVQCATQVVATVTEGFSIGGDAPFVPGTLMTTQSGPPYKGGPLPQCSPGNTACSVSALTAAGFTPTQAAIMSCIAITESSGNPANPPYNVLHPNHKPLSTACGLFSITKTTWENTASGACSSFSLCQNTACNVQVAKKLVQQSNYRSWSCPNCNNKASACVSQYGG